MLSKAAHKLMLAAFSFSFVAACETPSTSLYFISGQKAGIEIAGAAPDANNLPSLTIGYKLLDFAKVPVVVYDNDGNPDGTLYGCFRHGEGVGQVSGCIDEENGVGSALNPNPILKRDVVVEAISSKSDDYDGEEIMLSLNPNKLESAALRPTALNPSLGIIPVQLNPDEMETPMQTQPPQGSDQNNSQTKSSAQVFFGTNPSGSEQDQAILDAMSVFSRFRSEAKGDGKNITANLGIGKIFASGAAANHLGDGLGFQMKTEGYASQARAGSECIRALIDAAKQDGISVENVNVEAICGGGIFP